MPRTPLINIVLQILLVLLLVGGWFSTCFSQDTERFAPKRLEKKVEPAEMPELPEQKVYSSSDKKVLLENLSGMIFLRSEKKVIQGGIKMEGILVDGYLPEAFFEEMGDFLNKPLTLEDLNVILQKVIFHFRSQLTPVVDAFIPEQDITGGTVQVVIVEGRIGSIRAEGNKWFSSEFIEQHVRAKPGDIIKGDSLAKDVNWLNRNPFRHVDLVLARGEEIGQTDVILRTKDRFPVRFYAGYENSGNELTGRDRYLAGFNWGNAFGLGHLMDYQFTTGSDVSTLKAHSLNYEIPLVGHQTLMFSGAYAKSKPDQRPFDLEAVGWKLNARYILNLPSIDRYRQELSFGLDYKFYDNDLLFSSMPVFNKKVEIVQAVLGYGGHYPDKWGLNSFYTQIVGSPGHMSTRNNDKAFNEFKQGATAEYFYFNFDIERITTLPREFTWNVRTNFQLSDGPLLPSEQLGLGGYNSVRGFDEYEAYGDEGLLLVNEIRTPSYNLSSLFDTSFRMGTVQLLSFFDYGRVSNRDHSYSASLSSLGLGGRYRFGSNVSLRFDYGWQLVGEGNDPRVDSLGHVGLVIGY